MDNLTNEEIEIIENTLKMLKFEPGQSRAMLKIEKIFDKLKAMQENNKE